MIHITDFNGDIVDFISKSDGAVTEAEHMINVEDKLETFDFTVLTSRTEHMQKRNRVIIEDKDGQYREFIIYNISSDLNGYTRVQTNASALEDIKTAKPVGPHKLNKHTVKQALEYALADTGWEVSDEAEWGGTRTTSWTGWHDRISILKQLETTYGMRLSFYVEVGSNKITNRYVSLNKVEPMFNGEEIVYGDNMIDLKRTVDFSDIATALICLGPENSETGKREIVEIKDDDAQAQFGLPYRYIWDIYEPESSDENMTRQRLTTLGRTALNKRKQESISYEIDGIGLSASAGDMIRVKNEDFTPELYVDAEVVEVTTDLISGESKYKFGVIKEYTRDDVYARFNAMLSSLRERLNKVVENTDSIISERLEEELKYVERYIEKSPTPPLNAKEGQLWLDTSHDGVAVLKRYENGQWIKSSVDDVRDIGGMTREETMYESLKERHTRNEVDYSEVFKRHGALVSEKHYHYVDEDIKNDLSSRYNALQQIYDDFKLAFNNINTEQPTIGLITTAISRAVEFEARLKEYNDSYYVARKSFDEVIALLQSQYSDEKYNELLNEIADSVGGIVQDDGSIDMSEELKRRNDEALKMIADAIGGTIDENGNIDTSEVDRQRLDNAMELVAGAIGGTWNGNQLIADVPNREELDNLNQSIKQYLNGELDSLDGKLGKQIETVVKQAKDEFRVAIESVDKKVDGIEIGGRNLLKNTNQQFDWDISDASVAERKSNEITIASKSALDIINSSDELTLSFLLKTENLEFIQNNQWLGIELRIDFENGGYSFIRANHKLHPDIETGTYEWKRYYNVLKIGERIKEHGKVISYSSSATVLMRGSVGKVSIKNFMLNRGNQPLDWTPALEDTESDINNLTQEVTKNTTSLNVLENEISLKADSDTVKQILDDELEPIKSNVQSNQAELKVQSDLINSKVEKAEYEQDKQGLIDDISTARSEFNQTAESLKSNIDTVDTKVDNQNKNIQTNSSAIEQLNNEITLKTNSSDVKQLLDDELKPIQSSIQNNQSELKVQSDLIASKVESSEYTKDRNNIINDISTTKSEVKQLSDSFNVEIDSVNKKIDGIEVGGRNLLRYSTQKYLQIPNSYCTGIVEEEGKRALLFDRTNNILYLGGRESYLEKGKTYTFSFYAKASEELELTRGIYINSGNSGFIPDTKITTDWERYSFTFTASNDDSVGIHMYPAIKNADGTYKSFYITDWQLEKGTVATDVTPSLEDVESDINSLSQEITKNSSALNVLDNKINLKVDSSTVKQMLDSELKAVKSNVQTNQSELKLLSNQISSKVEKSEYTTDINGITQDIKNTKSEVSQLSESVNSKITSVEQKFDELNIEGRNLVLKSDVPYSNSNYLIADYTLSKPMEVGKTYTITIKGNVENTDGGLAVLRNKGKNFINRNIDKVSENVYRYTFTAINDTWLTDNIRLYNYPRSSRVNADIEWIKLEEGIKGTDHSLAPEDVKERLGENGDTLTKHETEIEQNKLGIGTKVSYTEMNGTNKTLEKLLTEFSQSSTGFNFRIDSKGMIQDLTFNKDRFKLNSNLIEFNDGDVVIKDGRTTIKDAFIEKLKSNIITSEQVRIAYNNISNSLQITPGGLETTIEGSLASRLNSFGHHFYFKGDYIGAIGTGNLSNYPNVRGLSMTLDSYGEYLAFGYRSGNVDADDPAQVALLWSKGSGGYSRGFHFNEDIKIKHNKVIETLWLRPSNFNSVSERISFSSGQIGGVQGVSLRYKDPRGSGIHLADNQVTLTANNSSKSGVGDFQLSFDKSGYYARSQTIYGRTYSSGSNLYITSYGTIGRSTSARKYKLSIENQFEDDRKQLEHSKKILKLNPRTWFDKTEAEIYAEELKTGEKQTDEKFTLKRYFGMIADEFEEIGMEELVTYDDKGEVEGLAYDRIPVHHNVLIKDLYKENDKLKKRIEKLEELING